MVSFWLNVYNRSFKLVVLAQKEVDLSASFVSGIADVLTRDTFIVIKLYFSPEGCHVLLGLGRNPLAGEQHG